MLKKLTVIFLSVAIFGTILVKTQRQEDPRPQPRPEIKTPASPVDFEFIHAFQSYEEIVGTIKDWESKASDLVDVGVYGQTTAGKDTYFIKISNEYNPSDEVVLITAAIHGNEPWSTSTVLAYAGKLIQSYGKDKDLTDVVNSRTIYIIPVVSPDTYPNSRHVDGVDPNRDFPTLKDPEKSSVRPVANLRDFFLKIKPDSVLSGHTFGRLYLIPWGDNRSQNPFAEDYERIASEMCKLSDYKHKRACEMYNQPIFGTEIDWYHRNGAFAMVMEFGTHQRKPSLKDTESEFERTFAAVVYFIKESTKVKVGEL